jgi:transposase
MVLSHSRYTYFQLVTTQKLSSFIECHYKAFEYFGGVPKTVKLDNLKAGVITPDFYEPLLQEQYAGFLAHYRSAPIACKVRRPEEKGKVESAIKYVKNNFLKTLEGVIMISWFVNLKCGMKKSVTKESTARPGKCLRWYLMKVRKMRYWSYRANAIRTWTFLPAK